MMLRLGLLLWVGAANVLQGADPATLVAQGQQAYEAKDYAKCAEHYTAAARAGAAGAAVPYNAACCYALNGSSGEAFVWLEKAIDAGWRDTAQLKKDADLASLHKDERWRGVVKRCEESANAFAKSLKEPALREELLKRMKEDQRIRTTPNPDMQEWTRIDTENTAYMKTVIEKYGWPGKSMVGQDGAQAVFLMVQHADLDPEFQKKCLPLLEAAVQAKEASAGHLAYLTDRVLLADGKPQRYGTQFMVEAGRSVPRPMEDPENVDARRKVVGLPPLAEYAKQIQGMQQQQEDEIAKTIKEPALRQELVKRLQEVVHASGSDAGQKKKMRAEHTAFIKTVIEKHGWPDDVMVGKDGAQAANVLVQGADDDPEFQNKCLPLLEAAMKEKRVSPEGFAALTDRLLVAEGKPQRYGTNFHNVDGKLVPRPIEDEPNLDARRKSVGLPPMAEHVKRMQLVPNKEIGK